MGRHGGPARWGGAFMALAATFACGCSLTLDTAQRSDAPTQNDRAAMGTDAATDVGNVSDDTLPADAARDVASDIAADAPADAVPDADLSCGAGGHCPEGTTCCSLNQRCVPAACLACCMFALDGGSPDATFDVATDATRDVPSDLPFDIVRDVPFDVLRDATADSNIDARADVGSDMVIRGDIGSDFGMVTLDEGPLCGLCTPGAICCGSTCTNTDFDESNCGGCGISCASTQVCALGMCRSCTATEALCSIGGDRCCLALGRFCTFACPPGS